MNEMIRLLPLTEMGYNLWQGDIHLSNGTGVKYEIIIGQLSLTEIGFYLRRY